MDIENIVRPRSLDEAYSLLAEPGAIAIGGGAWLRLGQKALATAVDLSGLGLCYIRESDKSIEIGAMATARDVETSPVLLEAFGPVFRDAVSGIVGVQMRNIVTVGGTVAGRYGFSDLNT
ncbi:MAG: FAD binding domain-containing protein, partial [Spirochaetales bacterium]|nr:FAD binding domain-containing protein [Spirochaetales bacterium]